jgi:hypothetical protein
MPEVILVINPLEIIGYILGVVALTIFLGYAIVRQRRG